MGGAGRGAYGRQFKKHGFAYLQAEPCLPEKGCSFKHLRQIPGGQIHAQQQAKGTSPGATVETTVHSNRLRRRWNPSNIKPFEDRAQSILKPLCMEPFRDETIER